MSTAKNILSTIASFLLAATLATAPASAAPQPQPTDPAAAPAPASIEISIVDVCNRPVPGVTINAFSGKDSAKGTTGREGSATLQLTAGKWEIYFAYQGEEWMASPTVSAGARSTIRYTLAVDLADYNQDKMVNSSDFFDFINNWANGAADINADNITDSQDFYDFLNIYFGGCGPAIPPISIVTPSVE